jgi:hypothetical protein
MKRLHSHSFNFSPKQNGGESLILTTIFYDNGDKDDSSIYTNQSITLQSYENSASINLSGIQITPEILRELADQLEKARKEAIK